MAGQVSFISIGVGDVEGGRAFHGALLGWRFAPTGSGATIDRAGVAAGIHGGDPGADPHAFFRLDDLDAALDRVVAPGGSVDPSGHPDDPAGAARFGRLALCRDDRGSRFGSHQPPGGDA